MLGSALTVERFVQVNFGPSKKVQSSVEFDLELKVIQRLFHAADRFLIKTTCDHNCCWWVGASGKPLTSMFMGRIVRPTCYGLCPFLFGVARGAFKNAYAYGIADMSMHMHWLLTVLFFHVVDDVRSKDIEKRYWCNKKGTTSSTSLVNIHLRVRETS